MKKLLATGLLAVSAAASAGDYTPFIGFDAASERDSLKNDYVNANITVGLKAPGKMEYSVRMGATEKESSTYSRNIEAKVKKSFDLGLPLVPYVALRLGQKSSNNGDKASFTHVAADAGLKIEVTRQLALDIGARYRDSISSSVHYQSTRYHAAVLYELDPSNVVGLRFTTSTSSNKPEEERDGWRFNYQHNF